jgi:acetyltransferase-like isoleucine patch superfamily enzyme
MDLEEPHPWLHERGANNRITLGGGASVLAGVHIDGSDNNLDLSPGASLASDDPTRDDVAIRITGHRNSILVGPGSRLNLSLRIDGDDCCLVIGRDCILTFNANLRAGGRIAIGDGTTMVKGAMQVHEKAAIEIGRDCMISTLVYISASDIHPIHDRTTGERINPPASVSIGDHVWLGLRSMIMKGTQIETGAVVAAGAVVSGHVPAHTIVAGAPARVLREDIEWRRDFE